MARRDTLCAGGCGALLWGGSTSLPPGKRMCLPCRRSKPPMKHASVCEQCGAEFLGWKRGLRFCSRTCYGMSSRRKRECPDCGCATAARRAEVVRCRPCAAEAARKIPKISKVYFPECLQCGARFTSRRSLRVPTCSEACKRAESAMRSKAKYVPHPRLACDCGASLDRWTKAQPHRRRCDDCKKVAVARGRAQAKRRRRARKRGAISEPYTLAEIAVRDGRRCGICKRKVQMKRAVPHPKAPTIDHIVPLADGGDDTRVNVQLACFLCNSIKSDGGVQQLALIG